MKKYVYIFLFSVFLASCVTTQNVGFAQKERDYWNTPPDLTKVIYAGGNGKSVENAIVIKDAEKERNGIAAEYDYISKKHGVKFIDWKPVGTSTFDDKSRKYDAIHIQTIPQNERITFYFDITEFYGK